MEEIDIKYKPNDIISQVIVGHSGADSAGAFLTGFLSSYDHVFAFFDKDLITRSRLAFEISLELKEMGCPMRAVEATEASKTMDNVLGICSWLVEKGADRDAVLLAVGGGITTDLVGFAASVYKRGVRYLSVPTTLLGQVDAGLGGKTAVNFMQFKNILGSVHQPEFTVILPEFLKTLQRRDLLSGAAEMIKSFIIKDESGQWYDRAVKFFKGYAAEASSQQYIEDFEAELTAVIEAAVKVKAGIVTRDPFEKNERRKLNLGHTFAHAIESLSQKHLGERSDMPVLDIRKKRVHSNVITHGEAVAIGMILSARLAEKLSARGLLDGVTDGLADRLEEDIGSCGIKVECPFPIRMMEDAMKKDKKADGDKVHFVLPVSIGEVIVYDMTVAEACRLLEE